MDIKEIQQRISRRTQAAIQTRYKIPFSADDAAILLSDCYKGEMMKRGINLDIDATTSGRISKVARWLTGDMKSGLLLYGSVGSGKTTMANAICALIGAIHHSVLASEAKVVSRTTALELADMKVKDEDKYIRFRSAELLFIDDLGTEPSVIKSYGTDITPITDLLLYRYDARLFTIITSNLDDGGIRDSYGARILDRFNEMFDKLSYTNPSYRK